MFIKLSISRSSAARRRATDIINSAVIAFRRRGAVSVVGGHWGTLLLMLISRIKSTNCGISCWAMFGKFSSPNVMLISRGSRWRWRVVRSVVFAGKLDKSRSGTLVICQLFGILVSSSLFISLKCVMMSQIIPKHMLDKWELVRNPLESSIFRGLRYQNTLLKSAK